MVVVVVRRLLSRLWRFVAMLWRNEPVRLAGGPF